MKILKLLIVACVISFAAYSQNSTNERSYQNNLYDDYGLIDTVRFKLMYKIHQLRNSLKPNQKDSKYLASEQFFKNKTYDGYQLVDTTRASPDVMARIHKQQKARLLIQDHYYYDMPFPNNIGVQFKSTGNNKSEIYEGLNWGPNNSFKSIIIKGDCAVEFAALDITEKNAAEYTYRVTQNDTLQLLPFTKPTSFKYTAKGGVKYADLDTYFTGTMAPRELKIELYKNNVLLDAMIIGWNVVKPAKILYSTVSYYGKVYNTSYYALINRRLDDHSYRNEGIVVNLKTGAAHKTNPPAVKDFIETESVNDIILRADDSVKLITFNIKNRKLYNYKVVLHRDADDYTDSVSLGEVDSKIELYKEFWKSPGKYKITFIPVIHKHGGRPVTTLYNMASSFRFTISRPLGIEHYVSLKTFIVVLLVVLSLAIRIFFHYRGRQKREEQSRHIAELQLQSVRSQLNPHFIFNALAGIQNLMNKNEVENANKYLARFARLTRNVLDDGQKELTTIEHEVDILTDYLQMEQMRFGFNFNIEVDKTIDQQIEIPAMLLQPFAENAVKHGVSALKSEGMIKVGIRQKENDIILTVGDNGGGFNATGQPGMGIKLCEERIKLLNSIYKNTSILLHINSNQKGALITIELKNWL